MNREADDSLEHLDDDELVQAATPTHPVPDGEEDVVLGLLNIAFHEDPPALTLHGARKMTLWIAGQYRIKPVDDGQEFLLTHVKRHKVSGKLIFIMDPLDAREWTKAELDEDKFFETWPTLRQRLAGILGYPDKPWPAAQASVRVAQKRQARRLAEIAAAEAAERNKKDDIWGLF